MRELMAAELQPTMMDWSIDGRVLHREKCHK